MINTDTLAALQAKPATAAKTSATAAQDQATMGKDQFLTLLLAQLKNQDPMSPMDNTEFTAQMAQFSSLEQLFAINKNMSGLGQLSASIDKTQALNLIGKQVEAAGDMVEVKNGQAGDIAFDLAEPADNIQINVFDASGQVVKTIERNGMLAGKQTVGWTPDGTLGRTLPDGVYTYSVEAARSDGSKVAANTFTRGTVSAVTMEGGTTYLQVGGRQVTLNEVTKVVDQGTVLN